MDLRPAPDVATAVPVLVDLPSSIAAELVPFVEATLGWHVVAPGGALRPRLALAPAPVPGTPTAVVLGGAPAPEAVRAALLDGAVDVVAWPDERDRLADVLRRASQARAVPAGAPGLLRVGGVAGGVGTSTVALALGALLAWAGRDVVVVGDARCAALAGIAWDGPDGDDLRLLPVEDRAGEVRALARPLDAAPGLRLLRGTGADLAEVDGWGAGVVVADAGAVGADGDVDVVVARADVGLLAAVPWLGDRAVVVRATGPLGPGEVAGLLGRRPDAVVPESARVAMAALRGAVPGGLPGSYVAALRALADGRGRR